MSDSQRVPQPPLKPVTGNLADVDADAPVQSLMRLARTFGPFFKLKILSHEFYFASSQALVNELCDETRFNKGSSPALEELRTTVGDGLFTAYNEEPNWGKAHRLLMPAFGPIGVRSMFDRMLDIADQMFVRWQRFGPNAVIDVADNMTRLTLDTIALCGFDYRFNSFYQNEMHPFVAAMVAALKEAGQRTRRPDLISSLLLSRSRKYAADRALLFSVARQLIAERRQDSRGAEKNDLLNLMLSGVDTVTGEKLSEENVMYQMVTFLVAGHETTSGLLSFATYFLLRNPDVLRRAREAVDAVLGDDVPRVEHIGQLRYVEQVLMETLRLWPTAPAFTVKPIASTWLGGKYRLDPNDIIRILIPMLHRDPTAWGDDVEAFRPERFAPGNAEQLPANAWKPFGNGMRACIGRPFAMQEAQLVLSMMLQRFDIVLDDPAYQLEIKETLTLKPHGLKIRARLRRDHSVQAPSAIPISLQRPLSFPVARKSAVEVGATPLLVLYGSNAGSSEAFANRIASEATAQGYEPVVAPMDDHAGHLPKHSALIVVTASYEGQPPDNARQFVTDVEGLKDGALTGLNYAVFGCGNRQWARTYQAIPKRIDVALRRAGANPVRERGEADSGGDFFGAFDAWYGGLWRALGDALGKQPVEDEQTNAFDVELVKGGRERALRLGDLHQGSVIANRELVDMTKPGATSKRHIEIKLPPGMSYRTGDYLAVLASNPPQVVEHAIRRFGLANETHVVVRKSGSGATSLPLDSPISVYDLLSNYVELNQPATRAQIAVLAGVTTGPPERALLETLASDGSYQAEVLDKRLSVLDLLERFHACEPSFAQFLAMQPPMRTRQYSISSSPLWNPEHVTLTVSVLDAPAFSGSGRHYGVASTYLAALEPGDRISVAVRPSNTRFHPPADPKVPIIMICAGSGIAPFRGFLQERQAQKAGGREVGPALLFFGAGAPDLDYLYRDEMAGWEAEGVFNARPAFSRASEGDVKYVQHRVWQERAHVADLFRQGATIYVCGDGKHMAPAVRETLVRIYCDAVGVDAASAASWADMIEHEHGRYVSDVFA